MLNTKPVEESDGEVRAPGRRLIVDARSSTLGSTAIGSVDPARQLLGLPLIRRTVLAARRCGFETVAVVADPDVQTNLARLGRRPAGRHGRPDRRRLW